MNRSIQPALAWKPAADTEYGDIRYEVAEGIAKLTISRPEVRNAFRPRTLYELQDALERARSDPTVGVIVLTGEGPHAFCSGGDQRIRGDDGYVGDDGVGRVNVLDLQIQTRRLRDRRRARPARRVRPHHRRRQRTVRADGPEGRFVRRRLRVGPPRPQRR